MRRSPDQTRPEFRRLRIYALDPMVSRAGEYEATVQIRYEDLKRRTDPQPRSRRNKGAGDEGAGRREVHPISFMGDRIEVVDVDASGPEPVWLKPVDLNDAHIAMQHGLEPLESDPQFHQQMVYAVAMRTLEQFDRALGRYVDFSFRRRLRLVPHAFRGSNAFYHPDLRAVLFGYFRANRDAPGQNLPGQVIFTCLSHDIVAHEVTHAIVDRLRPWFNQATNPHVRAFHEGFADIVAVFQRLTMRDLVQRALQDERGNVRQSPLLSNIAAQFGEGLGSGKALRTALDRSTRVQDVDEEHALGAVLVAAIFEGFYTTYQRRTEDLLRIATGGTGELPPGAIHPDLVSRLTTECVRTAQSVLTMCIRAFDYLPPTDVTFGAFLRALVTADWELNPLDEVGLRAAIIEACRRRGIFAVEAGSLAVSALLLDAANPLDWDKYKLVFQKWVDLGIEKNLERQREAKLEDPEALASESERTGAPFDSAGSAMVEAPEEELSAGQQLRTAIETWFNSLAPNERQRLGFLPDAPVEAPHFHANQRVASDGTLRLGLVVQIIQTQDLTMGTTVRSFAWGVTLVIDVNGEVRFVIKPPPLESRIPELNQMRQHAVTHPMGWPMSEPPADPFAVDYRGMHEART